VQLGAATLSKLMPLSDRVIVMVEGKELVEGSPKEVSTDKRVVAAYLGEKFVACLGRALINSGLPAIAAPRESNSFPLSRASVSLVKRAFVKQPF
jgi:energy-coupling factor transporter ATP-binding protein EcfA2